MKIASEFRAEARAALKGNWLTALAVSAVALLLGVSGNGAIDFSINVNTADGISADLSALGQNLCSFRYGNLVFNGMLMGMLTAAVIWAILATVAAIAFGLIVGGTLRLGHARYHLGLIRSEAPRFETLFGYFSHWKTAALAELLQAIYIFLWSLLLIVPGVMASYSYAMTEYILAEDPELSAQEAIARSKAMMAGNRWRLFCLDISFIGWSLLSSLLPLRIGTILLNPYTETAHAAFYRELTGGETAEEDVPVMPPVEEQPDAQPAEQDAQPEQPEQSDATPEEQPELPEAQHEEPQEPN